MNSHSLAHTFASHYVMRGGSLVKQAILGHASARTTQIYVRLSPDHLIGATGILDGLAAAKPSQINAPSTHEPVATARVGRRLASMRYSDGSTGDGAVAKW